MNECYSRRAQFGAGLAAVALSGALAAAPAQAGPEVTDFTLENGLRLVVVEDHRAPVVTHMVWYPVGAADEPPGHSGVAHFLEHLLFKATDDLEDGEFSRIVAANGGRDNAFTSYDFTGYFQTIAADRLGLVMGMEADRMVDLRLTEDVVATERDVILEERSQRTDGDPGALLGEQMSAALYLNHPYGIPVIGWRSEMETLSLEDAKDFYRRFYSPDNAIVVVAGDVEPAEAYRLAAEAYGGLAPSGARPEARPQEPPQLAERRLRMSDARVRQPYVTRRYLAPSRVSGDVADAAALSMAAQILGGDPITSRLGRALQIESGIAINSGAFYSGASRDHTAFGVYVVPAAGETLEDAEAAMDAVVAELIAEGPSEEELDRAKRLVRASEIYALDSQSGLARRYGGGLSVGLTLEEIADWPDRLADVTAEDVKRVMAQYLIPERSVTGWLEMAEVSQ